MSIKLIIASAFMLSAMAAEAGTTLPSLTDSRVVTSTESGWCVRSSMYIWTTGLDGEMVFRGTTVPLDVPFNKVLDHLKFSFMGMVEVSNGKWSFMSDLFYAKMEPSTSNRFATFESQIEQFIGNFDVFYRVVETPSTRLDVYGGARVNWMETDVDIRFNHHASVSESVDKTWVDPLIGVRFYQNLTDQFFIRALADIGGFGISSDITWQAMAALGYRMTDKASVGLGYRALGTDYTSGGTTYDVTSHGLLLGFDYQF